MARKFYYDTGKEKVGPIDGLDLLRMRAEGSISNDAWVRKADSSTWRRLSEVDLSQEEEEEANPTLWRWLTQRVHWSGLLLFCAVLFVLLALLIGLVSLAGPLLLIFLVLWILSRLIKG